MNNIARYILVCQVLVGFSQFCDSATLPVTDGDRIVFLGDSLTFHDGFPSYSDYLNAYLITQNPSLTLHIQSLARSGLPIEGCLDTSPIGYQHYSKWVEPLAPKYVFIMFADNGGYTKAIDKQWMQILVSDYVIGRNHSTPVLLGMIPQAKPDGYWPGSDYDDANEEIALASIPQLSYYKTWKALSPTWISNVVFTADASTGLLTAASHGFANGTRVLFQGVTAPAPLSQGTYYFVRDPTPNTFRVSASNGGLAIALTSNGTGIFYISSNWAKLRATSTDPVHPGPTASAIAAWKIITGLGWSTDVSSAAIDTGTCTVTSQKNCAITKITVNGFGGIDFMRLDAIIPWAIDEVGRPDAVALYPSMANWQNYKLQVSGLAAGTYDIFCNGEIISTVLSNTLTTGWNMSDLTVGPVWRQGQEVLGRIREMQGINRATLWSIQGGSRTGVEQYKSVATGAYDTNGLRGAALNAVLAPFIANIGLQDTLIHAAAQPTPLSFSIRLHGTLSPNTAIVTLGGLAQTYDGTSKTATAVTSPAGLTVAFAFNGSAAAPTTAGSYAVVGTVSDANYTGTATGTLVIAKANVTVTLGSLSQTYDASAKTATAITSPAGLSVAFTYNGSAVAPTIAGSYSVVGSVSDANYAGSAVGTLVITGSIVKTTATVILGGLAQSFDGTAKAATATTSPAGLSVTFTYNDSPIAPTTAGTYTVVGSINDPKYSGSASGTLLIAPTAAAGYVPLGILGIPEPGFGIREQAPPPPSAWPGAAATGSYYIDNTHPLATDASNANGYPNKPRLTIPTTLTVQAGTLVEIHGGPYLASATAYAWRVISSTTNRPTAKAPAYIRGIGHPVIGVSQAAIDAGASARIECGNVAGSGLHYTIFEGIHFVRMQLGIDGWDCQYLAVRNCEANGHYSVPFSVNPPADKVVNGVTYQGHIHDIVFYNNLIHDTAYWNDISKDWDYHGISVATFGRTYPTDLFNVWVLDSTFYHCSGDSVQVNGNTAGNAALHHIYIGRNIAWQNRQSGFWCKQASDVIMSQNTVHMMDVQGAGLTGTGIGSQYGADRLWLLYNHIYDCGYGFRQSDTTGAEGRDVYYIGNYIHDLHQISNAGHWGSPEGWGISLWSGSLNRHIIANTIANVYGGIETIQLGPVDAQDNLIYNLKPNIYPGTFGTYRSHIECNATGNGLAVDYTNSLLYGVVGGASQQARINWLGTQYTSLAAAQKALGKLANGIEADPLLMDGSKLGEKSPAINRGSVSDVYQTFQDLYGIDIRRGFDGGRRPIGSGWDIGAIEYSSATPGKPSYGGPVGP